MPTLAIHVGIKLALFTAAHFAAKRYVEAALIEARYK